MGEEMKVKPYRTWYRLDGMHIGYTPERIGVEDEGHCRVGGEWHFCPKCGRKAVNHER